MIKCNHYKLLSNGAEFLLYGEGEFSPSPHWKCELLNKDINISDEKYRNLPLYNVMSTYYIKGRTPDRILESENIMSYVDLANAYFLIKIKSLNKSKRVRDLVERKISEIADLIKLENENTESGDNQSDS